MLSQIATVVSLSMLSVSGIEFHRQPSFAVSSQSFHRDDIPLSYKFIATHDYVTPTSIDKENHEPKPQRVKASNHEPHLQRLYGTKPSDPNTPSIQYAPLTALYAKYYGAKGPKGQALENNLRKDHLEPRLQQGLGNRKPTLESHVHSTRQAMQAHGDFYVAGHNIQVMHSATRIPAHNAVYKEYRDGIDKQNQNLRQHLLYAKKQRRLNLLETDKTDAPDTTIPTQETTTPRILKTIAAINRYAHDTYNTAPSKPEKQAILLYNTAPYTKKHALFLNVARTYNFLPNIMSRDDLSRATRLGEADVLVHLKAPETQTQQKNAYGVLYTKKNKGKHCYGCGLEYKMYNK